MHKHGIPDSLDQRGCLPLPLLELNCDSAHPPVGLAVFPDEGDLTLICCGFLLKFCCFFF